MPAQLVQSPTAEKMLDAASGWPILALDFALVVIAILFIVFQDGIGMAAPWMAALCFITAFIMLIGFFTLQPNQARVLILFGEYKGTVHKQGFHWANPFYSWSRGTTKKDSTAGDGNKRGGTGGRQSNQGAGFQWISTKLSLRAHNFSSDALKVNDKRGNPVEIAAVVVWRIANTAQAAFDVEDYTSYVEIQSESAIRSIASRYAYDHGNQEAADDNEITLRGGADEVALALKDELQARLVKAGVLVEEARLTHLAYAPEIAPAMLRRQQAEAIIAARKIIVTNAVSMVHMALDELDAKNVVHLDDERKAAMVSNLLVVLCGNSEATPVINTGTLYT
jgi:regulator of protease activity HflC (stomatin/prohibitin superfamily)